jgi:hypothetical protein
MKDKYSAGARRCRRVAATLGGNGPLGRTRHSLLSNDAPRMLRRNCFQKAATTRT